MEETAGGSNRLGLIILGAVVGLLIIAALIYAVFFHGKIEMNPEGTVGNTAGNLNNGGLFCEYEDVVYFDVETFIVELSGLFDTLNWAALGKGINDLSARVAMASINELLSLKDNKELLFTIFTLILLLFIFAALCLGSKLLIEKLGLTIEIFILVQLTLTSLLSCIF